MRQVFEAPFPILRVMPLFALLPMFLSWFGCAHAGSIAFVAFAVFSMLFINTIEAIRNVDPIARVLAQTPGASRARVYRTVVVPAVVPELVGGMRVVLGLAWAILLAAEFLAAQSGIGRIMILIMLLIMLYTFVIDRLVAMTAAYATRWVPRV